MKSFKNQFRLDPGLDCEGMGDCAMIRRAIALGIVIVACAVSAAEAVDLNSLSQIERRRHCLGYLFLDAQSQLRAGAITQSQFNQIGKSIAIKLRSSGGNVNTEYRQVDRAVQNILAERPSASEIGQNAAACRSALRM